VVSCTKTGIACTFDLEMSTISGWLRDQGQYRGRLALTVALGEAAGILLILQTALLVQVADSLIFRGVPPASLVPLFSGALAVIALRAVLTWGSKKAGFSSASIVKRTLRAALVERIAGIGPMALAGMRAGEIAHAAVDGVEALDAYYAKYLPQRAIATLLPFTILAVVFPLDWISGLILVLTAVFLPLSMIVIGEEAHERNTRLWARLSLMSGRFLDILQGLSTVRMFDAARREAREIERSSNEYRTLTLSVLRVAFLSSFMLELIAAVSIAIVAVVSGLRLLAGTMSFRPAYFILLAAPEYFLTLRTLGTFYHSRMEAVSAAEQVRALLETPVSKAASSPAGLPVPPRAPTLAFRGVSFSYGAKQVLRTADFTVLTGEHVALTGTSGAGKSTIFSLLLRFAEADAGTITVDDAPLAALDIVEWRRCVAWLPQRPTLFHGTVRDNILLGRRDSAESALQDAIRRSGVEELLPRLPAGLDTRVGEGGQGLSAGQIQRVALARLFLRDPLVVLLDEPTAHLDRESAEMVSRGIRTLCEGRTTLLVTHKPETVQVMDRVLVLRDGVLEETP
jgi:ATP-binding cassette subfamily C protein CydD